MKVRHFKNLIKYRLAFFVAFPFLIQACSTMQVVESDISVADPPLIYQIQQLALSNKLESKKEKQQKRLTDT